MLLVTSSTSVSNHQSWIETAFYDVASIIYQAHCPQSHETHLNHRFLNPVSALENGGSEVAPVIGREDTGTLSTNHRVYFRPPILQSGDWV